jgi:large subunit ribosomal protein L31
MKKGIHPEYHKEAKITCACGNTITTGSTKSEINVEICSACHPFYTGKEKLIDTAGQVDRFKQRMQKTQEIQKQKEAKKKQKKSESKATGKSAKKESKSKSSKETSKKASSIKK